MQVAKAWKRWAWTIIAASGFALVAVIPGIAQDDLDGDAAALRPANELVNCKVYVIEEADIPARLAGALAKVEIREGAEIKSGQLLAQLDDTEYQIEKLMAQQEHAAAKVDSENDVNVRFSQASEQVALYEWRTAKSANERAQGTVPETEMEKLRHGWLRAKFSIEQAKRDIEKAAAITLQKEQQIRGVDHKIERTGIVSKLDGVVTDVHKQPGEWVNLGDTVCHVMRLDHLHVKGRVNVKDFSPKALIGRSVKVVATLDGNRREAFDGKLTYVSPQVGYDGEKFEVWAEVVNRRVGDQWELRPGMLADMTIDIQPGLQVTDN